MALHGATVLIKKGNTTIAGQRNCTINFKADTVEAHCKTDFKNKIYMSSWQGWDCSFDGVFVDTSMASDLATGTAVSVSISGGTGASAFSFTGNAIVTEASVEAPQDDIATISCTLQGTGALTIA